MLPQAVTHTELSRRPARSHIASPTIQALGGKGGSLAQSMQFMGATMSFARNSEVFGENEPADYVYCVVSGSVRTYKILNDGRRQVEDFICPATSSAWNSSMRIPSRPRRLPNRRCWS